MYHCSNLNKLFVYSNYQTNIFSISKTFTGNNVHTCSYCGRFFAHKHVYESHVRTHTGKEHNLYVGEWLTKRKTL